MDDRSNEIREGAGLEESRLNTEFIDALKKYSSPILFALAIIFGLYAGKQWLDQRANTRVNEAFRQHAEITETASPAPNSLSALASQYDDVGAIGTLARLREADVYMQAVRTGMEPGAEFEIDPETQQQTGAVAEEFLLSAESEADYLNRAQSLYEQVASSIGDEPFEQIHKVSAYFGLASVAEARGDADAARTAYESARASSELADFTMHAELAQHRIDTIDQGLTEVALLSRSDLPEIPEPEPIVPEAVPGEELPNGAMPNEALPEDGPASLFDVGPVGPELPSIMPETPAEDVPADDTPATDPGEPVSSDGG